MEVYGSYRANVALIREAIAENKQQMEHVHHSVNAFQAGLLGVEREMLPIYKLTEKLRETQKNIDLCVQELRRVNDNFLAAQQLAPTLLNGTKFDQEDYVRALEKLLVAIAFLENHRFYEGSGRALEQSKELLAQARKKSKLDFLNAVATISRGERDEATELISWHKPNAQDAAKISQLLHCLLSSKLEPTELLSDYGKKRFQVAKLLLCDDQSASVLVFSDADTIDNVQRRLVNFEATIDAERVLSDLIFSSEELAHTAFRFAVFPLLENLKVDLEGIVRGGSSGKGHLDPFRLLQLHELLIQRSKGIDGMLQPPLLLRDRNGKEFSDPWILSKVFASTLADVALATKQRLFIFQVEMTEQMGLNDRSLPKDGNVHPVSSLMINFVRRLCEHLAPLKLLLSRESSTSPSSYVDTAVMQLVAALQNKTSQFKGRSDLKHLFLANNYGFIAKALPDCRDKEMDAYFKSEVKPRLEELRDAAVTAFIQVSYHSFETFVCDPKEKLVYAKGGTLLTLESGRLLKEKFARFNAQIDDIHQTQRHFIVSEPHLRHQLIQAAVDLIVPRYAAFYEKYSVVHFSKKNSSKYLKYSPKAIEQILKELFLGEVIKDDC